MKRQDLDKYQQMDTSELAKKIADLEKEMVDLTMKKHLGSLKNVKLPGRIRHDIARLKTIITQKAIVTK